MKSKMISRTLFIVALSFSMQNICNGQQGHVVFGDPGNMCLSTGICNAQNVAFNMAVDGRIVKSTPAVFLTTDNLDGTFSLSMVIDLSVLNRNDAAQYANFRNGSYFFRNGQIPANVLNNIIAQPISVTLTNFTSDFSPTALPVVPPTPFYKLIPLGNFPGAVPLAAAPQKSLFHKKRHKHHHHKFHTHRKL